MPLINIPICFINYFITKTRLSA